MSYRAWAYVGSILAVGAILVGLALFDTASAASQWPTCAFLITFATLTQIFKAEGPSHRAFFATTVFLFAGVLLLPPFGFVLLVAIPHLIEWVKAHTERTSHLRAWYIQPFNIAKHLIAGAAARWVGVAMGSDGLASAQPPSLIIIILMVATYLVLNEGLVGQAIVLARGKTWRESGVFSAENLLLEFLLLCAGASMALLWSLDPWLSLPALAPLVLMYRALMIPKLKEDAQTDHKTGLNNARHFTKLFTDELERARRFDRPLAFIMADLDLLRDVNNTYGHLAGDIVLAGIGKIIRQTIREYDIAGRFGGEEFAIVVPEAGQIEAQLLAERIRQTIEAHRFEVPTCSMPIQVTMSLGIACFPQDATAQADLAHAADVAVYQAKLQGRNRVVSIANAPHSIQLDHITAPDRPSGPYTATFAHQPIAPPQHPTAGEQAQGNMAGMSCAVESTRAGQACHMLRAAFISMVIAAGALVATLAFYQSPPLDLTTAGLLVALAVLAELLQIRVHGDTSISVALAVIMAAALIIGVPGIAIVGLAITITDHLRKRRSLREAYQIAFNWAAHVLAGVVLMLIINIHAMPLQMTNLFMLGLWSAIATMIYYVIDTGLISIAISLSKRVNILVTWRAHFRWLAPHYLMLGMMGLFLSIAAESMGLLGIFLFTLPVLMLRYAQQPYVNRIQENVRELKRMNQELARANHEIVGASFAIRQLNGKLQSFNDDLFRALGTILDARDPYTSGHAAQVAAYAAAIAAELSLPAERIEVVRQAGFLHDLGKIAISEQLLYKPSQLSDEEYELIKTHAMIGADLIERSEGLRHLAPFIRYHHERWDGQGYPDGLCGEEIPLEARILNVCDSVEAMASDRPYHRGASLPEILVELRRCSTTQFDPAVVAAFIRIIEREGEGFIVNSAHEVSRKQTSRRTTIQPQSDMSGAAWNGAIARPVR